MSLADRKQLMEHEIRKAAEEEILIGIDPESYIGKAILRQIEVIGELRQQIREIAHDVKKIKEERQPASRRSW